MTDDIRATLDSSTAAGPRSVTVTTAEVFGGPAAVPRAGAAETPDVPLYELARIEVADVRTLDVMLPPKPIVRVAACWTTPVTIPSKDGRPLFTLTPTDAGQEASDVSTDLLMAIFDALGDDDAPEASLQEVPVPPDRLVAATAWARRMLLGMPEGPLARWDFKPEARRLMVGSALVRGWALPLEQASAIVRHPIATTRGVWPVGREVRRFEEQRRKAAEAAEAEAAARAAAIAEAARPRTWREMGATGVRVARHRLGVFTTEPVYGLSMVVQNDTHAFYAWRSANVLPGLEVPPFAEDERGIAPIDVDSLPPVQGLAVPSMTSPVVALVRQLRAEFGDARGKPIGTGPVSRQLFGDRGLERAQAIVAQWTYETFTPRPLRGFDMEGAFWSAIVRGCLIRPPVAVALVAEQLERTHGKVHAQGARKFLEDGAVKSAEGEVPGGVGIGELVPTEETAPPSVDSSAKAKKTSATK